jgi:hypothetical protein
MNENDCTQHEHGPKQITESQLRELRGKYFTVRHDVVKECGHKIDRMNEPSIGCEWCWWTWFSGHGELVKTTDEALQEHGKEFVIKLRGRRYLKYFLRFMSTLARFKKEQEELEALKAQEKDAHDTQEGSSRENTPVGTQESDMPS